MRDELKATAERVDPARELAREFSKHIWDDDGVLTASVQRYMRERITAALKAEREGVLAELCANGFIQPEHAGRSEWDQELHRRIAAIRGRP